MAMAACARTIVTIVGLGAWIAPVSGWGMESLTWESSYAAAVRQARSRGTMAFLWIQDPRQETRNERFEKELLAVGEVRERLAGFVAAKLPLDARYPLRQRGGAKDVVEQAGDRGEVSIPVEEARLLDHPAFAELGGEPGLAIIDLTDESSPYFQHVVSIYPLGSRFMTVEQLVALLELPAGSLTQRTLIWAVWTHPEQPQSANGQPHDVLEREAESHSRHQATIRVQGHHRWGSRFPRLAALLPFGLVPQEVCAESWPGQRLVDAAEECVRSWRHSSGHWDAVRRPHPVFGYDMKRGTNGIWYATGVFGRRE